MVVAAVFSASANADPPTLPSLRSDVPLSKQLHRHFSFSDGLPSNWMNDVVQTRDGYVWIATDNGLVRYDGLHFQSFNSTTTPQLPINEIRVLCEGRDASLWIGTTAGLTRYVPGRPGTFEEVPTVAGKTVRAIYEDRTGAVWVGTEQKTYVSSDGLNCQIVEGAPDHVRAICEDHRGTLWLGSNLGLFRRDGADYEQITHELLPTRTSPGSGIPQTRVNTLFASDDGGLWIGANRALLHMRDGQVTPRRRELGSQQIYDVLETRRGDLYVAARFGIYRSVGDGPLEEVSSEDSAFSLMEDHLGGLWVGHGDNRGLHLFRNRHAQDVWSDSRVRCVYGAPNGDLWFGSNAGLHRLHDGEITSYTLGDGLPDARVQTIVPGADDTLWIGTARGFVKWSGSAIVSSDLPERVANMNIGTALEDSTGALWFSLSSAGGFRLENGVLTELQDLRQKRFQWFWEDPEGVVWIGHELGLFQYADGKIQQVQNAAFERLKHPRVLCHFVSGDGTLWIGTSNGIVRYQSGEFAAFPSDSGLRADNIERIAADNQGQLWFGGRDGLFYADTAELNAFASGRLSTVTASRIEGFDRFPPLSAFSQGCLVRNGEIWIAAEHGLMKIPIEPFQRKPPPPTVYLEHAEIDGKAAGFDEPFDYPAGRRRLAIQFGTPALESPQHIQIRYRLNGHDDDWASAGGDRIAQYTDLRPGDYKFRVAARRGNGNWVETEAPMIFRVVPRWWEQTWFRVTAVLTTALAVLGLAQNRVRRYRKANAVLRREMSERQRAEEESRNNLEQLARVSRAAGMGELTTSIAHEIKQPLFAIVSNAQTARKLLDRDRPDVDEVREALTDIADDGNRASTIIDRIRSLVKKEHRPVGDLDLNQVVMEAIDFSQPELRKRGVEIQTDLASDLPAVNGDPIELQQVILNLLLNGAQAMRDCETQTRHLALRTSAVNGSVQVAVKDHGVGADDDKVDRLFEPFFTTKPEGTGMGLAINRTIIDAHGGKIWAERNEDAGLTFYFCLPVVEEPSQ